MSSALFTYHLSIHSNIIIVISSEAVPTTTEERRRSRRLSAGGRWTIIITSIILIPPSIPLVHMQQAVASGCGWMGGPSPPLTGLNKQIIIRFRDTLTDMWTVGYCPIITIANNNKTTHTQIQWGWAGLDPHGVRAIL